jgi:hypothetical protein
MNGGISTAFFEDNTIFKYSLNSGAGGCIIYSEYLCSYQSSKYTYLTEGKLELYTENYPVGINNNNFKSRVEGMYSSALKKSRKVGGEEHHFYQIQREGGDDYFLIWYSGGNTVVILNVYYPLSEGLRESFNNYTSAFIDMSLGKHYSYLKFEKLDTPSLFENESSCFGCLINNTCLPAGYRTNGKYCSQNNTLVNQSDYNKSCENNHECKSNLCVLGKCGGEQKQNEDCVGCFFESKCYSFNHIKNEKYCDKSGGFKEQKNIGESCENNFQCKSSACSLGKCIEQENKNCEGCFAESKCYSAGHRKEGKYCSYETYEFASQLEDGKSCENNFECKSNICIEEKCGEEQNKSCEGCFFEDKCYSIGYRKNEEYCNENSEFKEQKNESETCNNNHECKSNFCIDEKCLEKGFFQKILDFFKKLGFN